MSKKTYVLDTNVLLSDPHCLSAFEENDLIIPLAVLEELDRHKSRQDEVGKNARTISRELDNLRQKGDLFNLQHGVKLEYGGNLKVVAITSDHEENLPVELRNSKVDNLIIAFMLDAKNHGEHYILVSKDINVRLKCDSLGIKSEDYLKLRITNDPEKIYTGVSVTLVNEYVVDKLYIDGKLQLSEITDTTTYYPNQIVVIKCVENGETVKSALTKYNADKKEFCIIPKYSNVFGLTPKNKEQTFALDLLYDENVRLLTLTGPSGCGKTLLAIAAALDQLRSLGNHQRYERVIVTKPVQPVGKDIGFLPGTLQEKMEPWIAPIKDNMNFLFLKNNKKKNGNGENDYLSLMQEKGLIEIEAITFIRGRSIPNSFMIIDEAQNLSMHELKTIITRVGEGTKIVLTGDIEQIDNVHVDMYSNGLTYAIEKFKEHSIAGHVGLIKGERSALATLASQIL